MKPFNPVSYFEIPVTDLERAKKCYTAVFGYQFIADNSDGLELALFPFESGKSGITGALAKGDIYKPTKSGVLIYFNTLSIDDTLLKVKEYNLEILYPKTEIGEYGFVAEFQDSEGNRIGLHERL